VAGGGAGAGADWKAIEEAAFAAGKGPDPATRDSVRDAVIIVQDPLAASASALQDGR
jgi:hypothetical protein